MPIVRMWDAGLECEPLLVVLPLRRRTYILARRKSHFERRAGRNVRIDSYSMPPGARLSAVNCSSQQLTLFGEKREWGCTDTIGIDCPPLPIPATAIEAETARPDSNGSRLGERIDEST